MTKGSTSNEKAALRKELSARKAAAITELVPLLDKVPPLVFGGSVQTTRRWIYDNRKAKQAANRGSLKRVELELSVMREWAQGQQPRRDRNEENKPL